jgi:uncharacterized protein YneF (UPF0154 family)
MKNFLKDFWKKQKIKIILSIVITILTGIIGFGFSIFQKKIEKEIETRNRMAEIVFTRQIQYTDKMGRLVTEVTEQRVTMQEYQRMIDNGDVEKMKLQKQIESMGIQLKKVESMGTYGVEIKYDSLPILVYLTDSTEFDSISDGFVTLKRMRNIDCDTAIYNILVKDSLIWSINWYFLDKWKFKNIFCPRDKYYKLDAKMTNPNAEITYSRYFKFPKKKKREIKDNGCN